MSMPSYPKIFHTGGSNIRDLLKGTVEITEKLDGSSFGFGKINGELFIRSRRQQIHIGAGAGMFNEGVAYVMSIADRISDNILFYGEYLRKPRHNHITYERIPQNHIALFGAMFVDGVDDNGHPWGRWLNYDNLESAAEYLNVDICKLLYRGEIADKEDLKQYLNQPSQLGGKEMAEGIVIKNYNHKGHYGGFELPFLCGKLVRASFKERNNETFKKNHTAKGAWDSYKESFAAKGRWFKAIQHLRDDGKLTESPKDIGPLIKEIQKDITEECREQIMWRMWQIFGPELLRASIKGFPEWYKETLTDEMFEAQNDEG